MRRTLVLVVALGIVAMVAAPAQAGDRSGTGGPPVRAGAVSYLSPLHLGGMGIVESAGTEASGTDWRVGCWQAWAADYNWRVEQNRKAEEDAQQAAEDAADDASDDEQAPPTTAPPEPDLPYPDYGTNPLPGAGSAQLEKMPEYCEGAGSVIQSPDLVIDQCPYGTAFAVVEEYRWEPPPISAATALGEFVWSPTVDLPSFWPIFDLLEDVINEVLYGHCVDIFVGQSDIAGFAEVVPEPMLSISPRRDFGGITGMDTWLWYDFSSQSSYLVEASTTVGIGGVEPLSLTVDAQAWVDRIMWDLDGDGAWDREIDLPDTWDGPATSSAYRAAGGSESAEGAAATWVYETKGTYGVRIGMVWRGIYRYSGIANALYPYDPVTRDASIAYPVAEVRSLLRNDP